MTGIFVPYSIIDVCAIHESLVALISRINLGVLLLTVRTRHFPLSYEGVHGRKFGVDEWTRKILNGLIKVVSGRSDEIYLMFSSSA